MNESPAAVKCMTAIVGEMAGVRIPLTTRIHVTDRDKVVPEKSVRQRNTAYSNRNGLGYVNGIVKVVVE